MIVNIENNGERKLKLVEPKDLDNLEGKIIEIL